MADEWREIKSHIYSATTLIPIPPLSLSFIPFPTYTPVHYHHPDCGVWPESGRLHWIINVMSWAIFRGDVAPKSHTETVIERDARQTTRTIQNGIIHCQIAVEERIKEQPI